jgi:hypothetical protein
MVLNSLAQDLASLCLFEITHGNVRTIIASWLVLHTLTNRHVRQVRAPNLLLMMNNL